MVVTNGDDQLFPQFASIEKFLNKFMGAAVTAAAIIVPIIILIADMGSI